MKHIHALSRRAGKAYSFSIGYYLIAAGQIIGILAFLFMDKELPEDEPPETDNGVR